MLNKVKQRNEGFTIIEVMIVLAIAGLIMLVVFLAVPALQRNSRNTQRKNDISAYMGAIQEWTNNNNGKTPTTAADLTGAAGINSLVTMSTLVKPTAAPAVGAQTSAVAIDTIQIVRSAKCDPGTIGNTIAGPARSVALRYSVESSSATPTPQCLDS